MLIHNDAFSPRYYLVGGAAQFGGGGEGNALSWVTPPTAYRRFAARAALLISYGKNVKLEAV